MVKVGILSMQRILNYGSFLQAYSLKKVLENFGAEVEFVDYHVGKPLIEEKKSFFTKKIIKIAKIFKYKGKLKQKVEFAFYKFNFLKKYQFFLGLTKEKNYNPELDLLIIGSDEVFNCIQSNDNVGYSPELFGENNRANRLISYAASFGNTTLKQLKNFNKDAEVQLFLRKFDEISVRDYNSKKIVEVLTGQSPVINLDPTLIYDFGEDSNFNNEINLNFKGKFLILYAYSGRISDKESEYISNYARRKKLKILTIGGVQQCGDYFIDCSPFEVLNYFKAADEIITDTFHGSIFSIISKKRFITLVRRSSESSYGNEEKISFLLNSLGLDNRMTFNIQDLEYIQKKHIDYESVSRIIIKERNRAFNYIKENMF